MSERLQRLRIKLARDWHWDDREVSQFLRAAEEGELDDNDLAELEMNLTVSADDVAQAPAAAPSPVEDAADARSVARLAAEFAQAEQQHLAARREQEELLSLREIARIEAEEGRLPERGGLGAAGPSSLAGLLPDTSKDAEIARIEGEREKAAAAAARPWGKQPVRYGHDHRAGPRARAEREELQRSIEAAERLNAPRMQCNALQQGVMQRMREEEEEKEATSNAAAKAAADAVLFGSRPEAPLAPQPGPQQVFIDGMNVAKHNYKRTGVFDSLLLLNAMRVLHGMGFRVTAYVQEYVFDEPHLTEQVRVLRSRCPPLPPGDDGPIVKTVGSVKEEDDFLILRQAQREQAKVISKDSYGKQIREGVVPKHWVHANVCRWTIDNGAFAVMEPRKLGRAYRS